MPYTRPVTTSPKENESTAPSMSPTAIYYDMYITQDQTGQVSQYAPYRHRPISVPSEHSEIKAKRTTDLRAAIESRDLERIQTLLSSGYDLDHKAHHGDWEYLLKTITSDTYTIGKLQIDTLFNRNLKKIFYDHFLKQRIKKISMMLGPFSLVIIPVIAFVATIIPPSALTQIFSYAGSVGSGITYSALYLAQKLKLTNKKPVHKAHPKRALEKHLRAKEPNEITKTARNRYNGTMIVYAALSLAGVLIANYYTPFLIQTGRAILAASLGLGIQVLAGGLFFGVELFMLRKYSQKRKSLHRMYNTISRTLDDSIVEKTQALQGATTESNVDRLGAELLELRLKKADVDLTYQAKFTNNRRKTIGTIAIIAVFAIAAFAPLTPIVAPFVLPVVATAMGIYAAIKIYGAIKSRMTFRGAQRQLMKETDEITKEHSESIARVKELLHGQEQTAVISKSIVPSQAQSHNRHPAGLYSRAVSTGGHSDKRPLDIAPLPNSSITQEIVPYPSITVVG